MLNRTNRTLSANTNRLNLRTRSFALSTGTNMDQLALQTRHAQGHTVRAVISVPVGIPIEERYTRPEFTVSSSLSPWLEASSGIDTRVALGDTTPAPGLARSSGRACWSGAVRGRKALPTPTGLPKAKPVGRSGGAKPASGFMPRMPLVAAAARSAAVEG
jgi:hypothetical protein